MERLCTFLCFLPFWVPFLFPIFWWSVVFLTGLFFNLSILKQSALPLLVSSTKLLQSCCDLNACTLVHFLRCASLDEFHPPADREWWPHTQQPLAICPALSDGPQQWLAPTDAKPPSWLPQCHETQQRPHRSSQNGWRWVTLQCWWGSEQCKEKGWKRRAV